MIPKKYLYIALAVLVVMLAGMAYALRTQHQNLTRLRHNQELLLADYGRQGDSLEHYRTKSQDYAVSVGVLELSKSELERNCTRLRAEVTDLGLKLKRVEQASTSATETKVEFQTHVKDSIIYVKDTLSGRGHLDTLQLLKWQDPWVSFQGELRGESLQAEIACRDTLIQVVHRVPRKFLFIRWGTKELRQEVKSSNPHTTITFAECITIR